MSLIVEALLMDYETKERATTYRHKRYDARSFLPIPSIQLAPCSAVLAQLAPGQLSYASKRIETEARPIRNRNGALGCFSLFPSKGLLVSPD
jgi:hypothetical protein